MFVTCKICVISFGAYAVPICFCFVQAGFTDIGVVLPTKVKLVVEFMTFNLSMHNYEMIVISLSKNP